MKKFDLVIELIIDEATMRHRIATRQDGNDWGKRPDELATIVALHRSGVDKPKGAIEIDATQPLNKVVHTILTRVASIQHSIG